ncbi:sugar ABC transporter permease, partial [Streptomyces sp. SID8014]|nr:sugar ABC transporter permease [Streptomyces sp. SID8014]
MPATEATEATGTAEAARGSAVRTSRPAPPEAGRRQRTFEQANRRLKWAMLAPAVLFVGLMIV